MNRYHGRNILIFWSDISDGNMAFYVGSEDVGVLKNRKKFFQKIGIDSECAVFAQQTHGDCVRNVGREACGRGMANHEDAFSDTDAFITDEKCVVLCVQVADCVPIAIWDEAFGRIAIVHAGWRGMAKRIIEKTVRKMQEGGLHARNMHAWIGPSAGPCCFELGEEEQKYFQRVHNGKVDLWQEAQDQLELCGVPVEHIENEKICTICDERFFSYRRERECAGRIIVGIVRDIC